MADQGGTRRRFCAGLAMAGLAVSGGSLGGCGLGYRVRPIILGGKAVSPDAPILAAIEASDIHRTLAALIRETGFDDVLSAPGPFTLFAPTDAAFAGLRPKGELARMRAEPGYAKFVLEGHVFRAQISNDDLIEGIPTIAGRTKIISMNNQVLSIRGKPDAMRWQDLRARTGNIIQTGGVASNGLIHVIDNVILPDSDATVSP